MQKRRSKLFYLFRVLLYVVYVASFFYFLPQNIAERKRMDIFTGIVMMIVMLPFIIPDMRKLIRK